MRITYDREVDALSIVFLDTTVTIKHLAEALLPRVRSLRRPNPILQHIYSRLHRSAIGRRLFWLSRRPRWPKIHPRGNAAAHGYQHSSDRLSSDIQADRRVGRCLAGRV